MEEFVGLLERERAAIVKRDLDDLLECVRLKEVLHTQWLILEEAHRALLERLGKERGLSSGEELDLPQLISDMDPPIRQKWEGLREMLADKTQQAKGLQEGNRYLINAALGHVSKTLALLSHYSGATTMTYDRKGLLRSKVPAGGNQVLGRA